MGQTFFTLVGEVMAPKCPKVFSAIESKANIYRWNYCKECSKKMGFTPTMCTNCSNNRYLAAKFIIKAASDYGFHIFKKLKVGDTEVILLRNRKFREVGILVSHSIKGEWCEWDIVYVNSALQTINQNPLLNKPLQPARIC